jgi:hypothetical protein
MYDKYSKINSFTQGSVLPKHKGILFSTGAAAAGATFSAFQANGSLISFGLTFAANTSEIYPIQVQRITLGSGLTAFYLN